MKRLLFLSKIRDKRTLVKYIALFLLIILCLFLILSILGSAYTIQRTARESYKTNKVEDGNFSTFLPLTAPEAAELSALGITLAENFSLDYQEDKTLFRIFKLREAMNLVAVTQGKLPTGPGEIILEKHYAKLAGKLPGSQLQLGTRQFTVTGLGVAPDYESCRENPSDLVVDHRKFAPVFVTPEGYALLKGDPAAPVEVFNYTYLLNGASEAELKAKLQTFKITQPELVSAFGPAASLLPAELARVTSFLPQRINGRIGGAIDGVQNDIDVALFIGVVACIILAYVLSIFILHTLEQEKQVIGTLLAQGVPRRTIIVSYASWPVIVAVAGGLASLGVALTPIGIGWQMRETLDYFSLPTPKLYLHPLVLVYALVLPGLMAFIVNSLAIRRKLRQRALSLLRNEQNVAVIKLPPWTANFKFTTRFRIKQFWKEKRSALAMPVAMFFCLLVLFIALSALFYCRELKVAMAEETRYEYRYTLKYPEQTIPEGGEAAYLEVVNNRRFGKELSVLLVGLGRENPYFPRLTSRTPEEVSVSKAFASKYPVQVGSKITLTAPLSGAEYQFTVKEIVDYRAETYVFMDIAAMRTLFAKDAGYYNVLYSAKPLTISADRLYNTATKTELVASADVFIAQIKSLITILIAVSLAVIVIVMYQIMKVMLDRASLQISLLQIFGFSRREVRGLYLGSNFILIVAGTLVSLPLAKLVVNLVFPRLLASLVWYTPLAFPVLWYVYVFSGVLAGYFLVGFMLLRKIAAIKPAELLKNQE